MTAEAASPSPEEITGPRYTPETHNPNWRLKAACANEPDETMMNGQGRVPKGELTKEQLFIRDFCGRCTVRLCCLDTALQFGESEWLVWGGFDVNARRPMHDAYSATGSVPLRLFHVATETLEPIEDNAVDLESKDKSAEEVNRNTAEPEQLAESTVEPLAVPQEAPVTKSRKQRTNRAEKPSVINALVRFLEATDGGRYRVSSPDLSVAGEIAAKLGCTESTVKLAITNLFYKGIITKDNQGNRLIAINLAKSA